MTFTLPDARFGMTRTNYNMGAMPKAIPEYEVLEAANRLNEHRYHALTHRQRVFVDAYLSHDFDATAAALEAGFNQDEAVRVGKKMLQKKCIQQALRYALQYYTEKEKLRFERLVEELKIIALTVITDLVDPQTAEPKDVPDNDPRWRAVKRIKRTETKYGVNIEYELYEKNSAIDKLIKILKPDLEDKDPTAPGTNVNVTNVNILPVPSGQFLPPPPSPYDSGNVIEHQPFDRPVDQTGS
ncbi:hypothetical protein [Synechococcus phage Ssp-JY38]|nr:terminase small subunit [Synechococcus phage Yong-L2-223]